MWTKQVFKSVIKLGNKTYKLLLHTNWITHTNNIKPFSLLFYNAEIWLLQKLNKILKSNLFSKGIYNNTISTTWTSSIFSLKKFPKKIFNLEAV